MQVIFENDLESSDLVLYGTIYFKGKLNNFYFNSIMLSDKNFMFRTFL